MCRLRGQSRIGEKTQRAKTIVDRDDHYALPGEIPAVVRGDRGGSFAVSASVNPEHHRQFFRARGGRRPDVQVQAVLADVILDHEFLGPRQAGALLDLHAAIAELVCLAHAFHGFTGCGARHRSGPTGGAA